MSAHQAAKSSEYLAACGGFDAVLKEYKRRYLATYDVVREGTSDLDLDVARYAQKLSIIRGSMVKVTKHIRFIAAVLWPLYFGDGLPTVSGPVTEAKGRQIHTKTMPLLSYRVSLVTNKTPPPTPQDCACTLYRVFPSRKHPWRLMVDCRGANERIVPLPGFYIFSVENLHEAIDRWGRCRVMVATFEDLLVQAMIPKSIKNFFVAQHEAPEPRYCLTYVPHSFHSSHVIAQAFAWALVLHREPGDELLGVHPSVYEFESMPPFVSLWDEAALARGEAREIGRIFVLCEQVAVFSEADEVLIAWKQRIDRNAGQFTAVMAAPGSASITLTTSPQGVSFAGVNWNVDGVRSDIVFSEMPTIETLTGAWHTTSSLIWNLLASGQSLCTYPQLLKLAVRIARAREERNEKVLVSSVKYHDWPFAPSGPERKILQGLWEEAQAGKRAPLPPRMTTAAALAEISAFIVD